MEVKIETTCGRCSKREELSVSLEEAQDLQKKWEASETHAQEVPKLINNVLGSEHPDIVIAVKSDDGNYAVKTLRDLCKGERSCSSAVARTVKEIFKQPTPRKPRKKKTTKPKEE